MSSAYTRSSISSYGNSSDCAIASMPSQVCPKTVQISVSPRLNAFTLYWQWSKTMPENVWYTLSSM